MNPEEPTPIDLDKEISELQKDMVVAPYVLASQDAQAAMTPEDKLDLDAIETQQSIQKSKARRGIGRLFRWLI